MHVFISQMLSCGLGWQLGILGAPCGWHHHYSMWGCHHPAPNHTWTIGRIPRERRRRAVRFSPYLLYIPSTSMAHGPLKSIQASLNSMPIPLKFLQLSFNSIQNPFKHPSTIHSNSIKAFPSKIPQTSIQTASKSIEHPFKPH